MPDLAPKPTDIPSPGRRGIVATPPTELGAPFTVVIPEFDANHIYEIERWASRAATLPAVGDECLVVLDDKGEPWVAAWWPAGGDPDGLKGVIVHGADPTMQRRGEFASVEWIGTVEPLNALDNDTWVIPA